MPNNDVYIMYSGATDVTGQKLQEALDINGGRVTPKSKKKIVIGWGPKTKNDLGTKVGGAGCVVLNHPDSVRKNRNKFSTILSMREAGVNIKNAASSEHVFVELDYGNLSLPLIGRRNFHQGGKGFYTCLTRSQVQDAIDIEEGAQYFQDVIDIKTEYRLHIINGALVYAQKKVKRDGDDENAKAFVEQQKEKIGVIASKNNKELDADTMEYVLGRLAKEHQKPDLIVRSNTRGWKFSRVTLNNVNPKLTEEAIKALSATGLTFGAVDCAITADGEAYIIELNTGPGLDGSSLEAYVETLKALIEKTLNPPKAEKKVANKSKPVTTPVGKPDSAKANLQAKLSVLNDLVSVASEDESKVLANLWDKLG